MYGKDCGAFSIYGTGLWDIQQQNIFFFLIPLHSDSKSSGEKCTNDATKNSEDIGKKTRLMIG